MNNFLLLTKINILDFLNLKKITNYKYKKDRKKNLTRVLLAFVMIIIFLYYVYQTINKMMPNFVNDGKEIYILGEMFLFLSLFILLYDVFKIKNTLFKYKDYELLNTLPIKRITIIFSKLFSFYLLNLAFTMLIMIPTVFAYDNYANISFPLYLLLLLVIPIIPLTISLLLGIILSWFINIFHNRGIISYLISIIFLFLIMFILFNNISNIAITDINYVIDLVNNTNDYYPFIIMFTNLLTDFSVSDFLIFMLVPLLINGISVFLINKNYLFLRRKVIKDKNMNEKNTYDYKIRSSFISLYRKELKRITSNPFYIINSTFGIILIIMIILYTLVFGNSYTTMNNFKYYVIIFISFLCMISSTTHASISLEGKSLWIMKMLPVKKEIILGSKVLVNLTFLIPVIILSTIFFGITLDLDFNEVIFVFLMPLMYSLFTSFLGLILNLAFPRFDSDNDIKLLAQSMPAFLNVFLGLLISIFPLTFVNIDMNYVIMNTKVVALINLFLIIILHFYSKRRINLL